LPQFQSKITFFLPASHADWAGQALHAYFPDGLLSENSAKSQIQFSGWPSSHTPHSLQELKRRLLSLGATQIRIKSERTRDWVHEYKSHFPVQNLGPFVILPQWRRKARLAPGKMPIVLLPGQAFGTGLHESTRLMLAAIAALPPAKSVLDIGAGSGVLGFACLRKGAKKIVSIEIEKAAAEEMLGNRVLNGFKASQFSVRAGAFPGLMRGKRVGADLLLANLVTPLLCDLMKDLAAQASQGATLLFSGIHTEAEARAVAKAARNAGLRMKAKSSKGEWWCLRASK
jgi:ribosomal protein L11 methyltransferase